ncbi:hypothetical protein FA13DRAFT_1717265 [Coprinellus micaceus]|uniref:Uncharacterized protein n=1 Tax=Coprinellus micaceus TaxID=71717 RepID=A0A4Y7SHD9_COPMI|nr:hypothetical protein FA13DRAFT_1717265 [Coprinellus micaceus]
MAMSPTPMSLLMTQHSVHYPPYRILLNEFISLKGQNTDYLKSLLSRQPHTPTPPAASNPSLTAIPVLNSVASRHAAIRVSAEDAKHVNTPLKQSDFPNVRIWTKEDWTEKRAEEKALGNKLHCFTFFVDEDGDFVGQEALSELLEVAQAEWEVWVNLLVLPASWKKKQQDAVTHLKVTISPMFPWLFYCKGGDWKMNKWATLSFSDLKRRVWANYSRALLANGLAVPGSASDYKGSDEEGKEEDGNACPTKCQHIQKVKASGGSQHPALTLGTQTPSALGVSEPKAGSAGSQKPLTHPTGSCSCSGSKSGPSKPRCPSGKSPKPNTPKQGLASVSPPVNVVQPAANSDNLGVTAALNNPLSVNNLLSQHPFSEPDLDDVADSGPAKAIDFEFTHSRSASPVNLRSPNTSNSQQNPPPNISQPTAPAGTILQPPNPLAPLGSKPPALTFVPLPPGTIIPSSLPTNLKKKEKAIPLEVLSDKFYTARCKLLSWAFLSMLTLVIGQKPTSPRLHYPREEDTDLTQIQGGLGSREPARKPGELLHINVLPKLLAVLMHRYQVLKRYTSLAAKHRKEGVMKGHLPATTEPESQAP